MRRLDIPTLVLAFVLFLLAPHVPALAHGFGRTQDIPLPFWLYLFGINAVVLATFVQVASFLRLAALDGAPEETE